MEYRGMYWETGFIGTALNYYTNYTFGNSERTHYKNYTNLDLTLFPEKPT